MDLLRGLAVLLVVTNHAAVSVTELGLTAPAAVSAVNDVMAPFRIPLLVFLSGLLLGASLGKGAVPYLEGKVSNIAWPYLVWLALHATTKDDPELVRVVLGDTQLWFLLFLGFYYVLALALRRVPPLVVVAGALVLAEVAPGGGKYGERLWFLFAVFMLGHWVAGRTRVWPRFVDAWWVLVGSLLVVGGYLVVADSYAYGPRSLLVVAAGVLALCHVARRVARTRVTAPVRFVGRSSIVVYVAHAVGMQVVALVAVRQDWASPVLAYTAFLAVGVAFPVALILLGRRWRPAQYLFTLTPRGARPPWRALGRRQEPDVA